MYSFRITKYNPCFRNENDIYTRTEEWTSISDIGKILSGEEFTKKEYLEIERKYIQSVELCIDEMKANDLIVKGLEIYDENDLNISEGMKVNRQQALLIIQKMLREEMWCKLIQTGFEIHVGYDYYMYIVTKVKPQETTIDKIYQIGLFVEDVKSPYLT
ncbi:hypothetical protein [Bacillus sp. AFS088145]|uniref:hypothetical protein n=1 Tax=Bacillus sp. AFS088145 TaxID=2033514 RepID=UPI000BF5D3F6|nr:hypothetical protein [Bacillus sp. AFS088145]PFH81986.1 hypothetical protein COI44_22140 [Bacillus sp. AFS088145]